MVFRLFLSKIKEYGYAGRMKRTPKSYEDPTRFHQKFWVKFTNMQGPTWQEMSHEQKRWHLWKFLMTLFSLDPLHRGMLPGPYIEYKRRNDACWEGFWMCDEELAWLVFDIMEDYRRQSERTETIAVVG
jgi:hypothetical protein